MAQTGYTPILIYSSSTGGNQPLAGSLTNSTLGSELAINITDGKLFYKDNANAVQVIGWKTTPTTAGGTGLTSYTAGDLLYYATGTTLSKLAIGTSGQWLGSSGTAPQWNSPAALTKTDDTNVTLTLGGSASTALLNAASLTLGWTGQLAASRGGTGIGTYTVGDILYASGTTALSKLAIGANTTVLTSSGSAPQWTAASSVAIGTATNLAGGLAGSVPYQSGAGATTFLGIGAANTVMTSSGSAPQWSTGLALSGNVSAAALIPSSSTVPTNGMYYPAANRIGFATNSTFRGGIDANGLWGINNAGGYAQLGILNQSASKTLGATGSFLVYSDNTGSYGGLAEMLFGFGSGWVTNAISAVYTDYGGYGKLGGALAFSTTQDSSVGLTERMRLFSSGGLSLGNTTDPGAGTLYVTNYGYFGTYANLGSQVQVNSGTKNAINLWVSGASTDGTSGVTVGKVSTTNTSSQVFCEFWINAYNTASGRIVANGASAAAFASYSDRTLKENIVPLAPQLENINALKPCEFDYKDGSGHQIGFIAQDHQQVYPDDVSADDKGILSIVGWSKTEARLVSAIQQLSAQVTQLQAQVKALENK